MKLTDFAKKRNAKFRKRLQAKLNVLNDNNTKKGIKERIQWTACENVEIVDEEHKAVCSITPA